MITTNSKLKTTTERVRGVSTVLSVTSSGRPDFRSGIQDTGSCLCLEWCQWSPDV